MALLLLLLTALGPLLAWRKNLARKPEAQFLLARGGRAWRLALFLMLTPSSWGSVFGMKPWQDISYFYSLMAIMLSALVGLTVISEFVRGGRVIRRHTGQNLLASMVHLAHRNTRRYGGYIVHFGVVVVVIGFAGSAFNQDKEKEMGFGDKMNIGAYTLVCRSYTQDDNPNYGSEWAIMDVFRGGKQIATMYPERRFYKASQQTSTMVANRSTLERRSLPGVRRAESGYRAPHHQSARQSAGHVDLDGRLDHDRGNDAGPDSERRAGARGRSGASGGRSGGSGRLMRYLTSPSISAASSWASLTLVMSASSARAIRTAASTVSATS